jgi:hypothetical protein
MVARVRVCTTFQTGTAPTGTFIDITDGDVTLSAHDSIRSTVELVTPGASMWPKPSKPLLFPYGNELFVERGVKYGNGSTEWVSLGYFRIQEPDQADAPLGPIRLSGRDRMAGIVDGRMMEPCQFTANLTYGAVVSQLVLQIYPSATIQWDSGSTDPIGRDLIAETDRYGFLDELITGLGKIWYWDYRGILVITNQPTVASPVFDITAGANGVLCKLSRKITRTGVFNAIVATGEGADTSVPVRAVAIDNNPASPTYYYGPFGPVPDFISSPSITGDAQATAAAIAALTKQLGLRYEINFAAVPNPALEPWDAVRVRSAVSESVEFHTLERLTIPLTAAAPMTATTREQTLVMVGVL